MLAPVLVQPPAVAPVSLDVFDGAKVQARVDGSDEDGLLEAYIDAATAHLDGYAGILGRALITQTWRQDFRCFSEKLRLPLAPVQDISSVTYYDAANSSATLAPSIYTLHADALGFYVGLAPDESWPSHYARPDAISVTFVAGYGDAAADVPAPIRQAIRMMVAHWNENREGRAEDLAAVRALITPYRRMSV